MRHDRSHLDQYLEMDLFAGCSEAEVNQATRHVTRVTFPAGKVLATQRRCCRQFALIVAGTVAVERNGDELETLGVGDHFGEFTVVRGLPSPTTLVARTPVAIDVVSEPEFRSSFVDNQTVRDRIDRECDRRIRDWVRSPIPAAAVAVPAA